MILFRYLAREVLLTMLAVAGILLLIIMGSRFIRYVASAAEGNISLAILGNLMLFHLPGFFELVLPLALFLGILLAYGQLYMNSEITVMVACGISPAKLFRVTLLPATLVAGLVGLCSLWLTPLGAYHTETLLEQQRSQLDLSVLAPGRFQGLGEGRTVYIRALGDNGRVMQDVMVTELDQGEGVDQQVVTRARRGYQVTGASGEQRFLVLEDGQRHGLVPGEHAAEQLDFERYRVALGEPTPRERLDSLEYASTPALLKREERRAKAQLQWRAGLPLMVFVLALIAQPLSQVNPRQGRFARLLPAIFIYVAYLSLLLASIDLIGRGDWPVVPGVWPLHAAFLCLGAGLIWRSQGKGGR